MKKQGFTLIELSIVLVIIGLIVGGILAGQELIHAAQLRSQISQFGRYDTAINTFRVKYNGIPGDLKNAVEVGLSANTDNRLNVAPFTQNGDGDRMVEAGSTDATNLRYGGEMLNFWVHLNNAGLIEDNITNVEGGPTYFTSGLSFPKTKIGESTAIVSSSGYLYYILGGFSNSRYLEFTGAELALDGMRNRLTAQDAYNIDQKMDDGSANGGTVRPISQYAKAGTWDGTLVFDAADNSVNCIYNGDYNVTYSGTYNEGLLCTLAIRSN